ncbi:protein DpdF [Kitasatospora sp. NPDC056184]|uniref:protein DpdF n=1 Tax=Kitasatospora sp. NPDC056184 TaxID=3345738 RepID=UPI0035DCB67A
MSTDEWDQAHRLFDQWPSVVPIVPAAGSSGTVHRLAQALASARHGRSGWRDIASLTRQILLRARLLGNVMPLPVPLADGLPTREQWRSVGCPGELGGGRLRIHAEEWAPVSPVSPTWEPAIDQVSWAIRGDWAPGARPAPEEVEADPFWKQTLGFPTYRSLGQRQIARAVVLAPPGSTTIACLPTGHGKTPVALAAALLAGRSEGVSVLVVPTVILAIDMERRVREILAERDPRARTTRYAYVGALRDDEKREICDAVAAGRRPVVITSPEAVTKSALGRAIDQAADAGLLRYLIIDEAHLVEQWGAAFRSDFQTLATHWQAWLGRAEEGSAVRTLAMSATLTEQQIRTLERLFDGPGGTEVVWASELRQEPAYFIREYLDEPSRRAAVLEAATLLPSPAILYTTEKADANAWAEVLRAEGMRRVAVVHGDSTEKERRDALEGWSGTDGAGRAVPTRFDVVVGTSAFGLGVDLGDVRTVLHATVPETVDRYYQEVGRGGRDGNPCLAFLAFVPQDRAAAATLNRQSIITNDVAWDRWHSMLINAVPAPVGASVRTRRVDVRTQRPMVREESDQNVEWNMKILSLMKQAGLIDMRRATAPTRAADEDEESWLARQQAWHEEPFGQVDVELRDGASDEARFKAGVQAVRERVKSAQRHSLERMYDILAAKVCTADVLASHYTVRTPSGPLTTSPACRGCPGCRRTGLPADGGGALYRVPVASFPGLPAWPGQDDPLERLHRDGPSLSLYWRSTEEYEDETVRLLSLLAARGTAFFGGPGLTTRQVEDIQYGVGSRPVIHDADGSSARDSGSTVAWVLSPDADAMDETALLRYEGGDRLYLLHPSSLRDPGRPDMLLRDMHAAAVPLAQARKAL